MLLLSPFYRLKNRGTVGPISLLKNPTEIGRTVLHTPVTNPVRLTTAPHYPAYLVRDNNSDGHLNKGVA